MNIEEFDYELPPERIAQQPAPARDRSRLLVLERSTGRILDTVFHRLPEHLRPGDLLVANNTRVIPARLYGTKKSGGWAELFLLTQVEARSGDTQVWECLLKSKKKIEPRMRIHIEPRLSALVLEQTAMNTWLVQLNIRGDLGDILQQAGKTPLPPYIRRSRANPDDPADRNRYQTVFAAKDGAVAAPTAGLHFTEKMMDSVRKAGCEIAFVTLTVGYGTFQPVREETIEQHRMHKEHFHIPEETARKATQAKQLGNRVIAVGTTTTRALESMTDHDGTVSGGEGYTGLFIYPGYTFKAVDSLITNFHLPRSSLIMLVSALAGTSTIMAAYRHAIENKYRFYSYGDAMFIV